MVTAQEEPPDYWDLIDSDPRAFALAGGLLYDFQWWSLPDLIAQAGIRLGAFRDLVSETLRQAVHRATRRLQRVGIVEIKMEGRTKYVRRVQSAQDLAAMEEHARERKALEEAAKDFIEEDSF
jgi:hypothetical protein